MITACMYTLHVYMYVHMQCVQYQVRPMRLIDTYSAEKCFIHTKASLHASPRTKHNSFSPLNTLTKTIAMFEYNNHVMINYIASIAYTQKLGDPLRA